MTGGRDRLEDEVRELRERRDRLSRYIREKADGLLLLMGSKPLRSDEIDDDTLLNLDPIGTIAESFGQVMDHIRTVNEKLRNEVAERRRVEEVLREQGEKFRTLAEFSSDWVFWRSPEGELHYVAPACAQVTGYAPAEFYANPALFDDIVHPEERSLWQNHVHWTDKGIYEPIEFRIVDRSGATRWISHVCRPVLGPGGEFLGVRGSNSDITQKKSAEIALKRSGEELGDFFDNAIDLILSVSVDGKILYANRALKEELGYGDGSIEGISFHDVVDPAHRESFRWQFECLKDGVLDGRMETVLLARTGRRVIVEGRANFRFEDGAPVSFQGIFRDVTEQKHLEEDLLKARKLEAIGVLAGGIAHDFNNLLTGILGNISLAKLVGPQEGELVRRLERAEQASHRARLLTRRLLTFSEGGAPVRKPIPVHDLVRGNVDPVLRGQRVVSDIQVGADLPPVLIDEEQMGNVIRNIVSNADQAMPDGGRLTVRAEFREVEWGEIPALPSGQYVRLTVGDEGEGIAPENLPRVFDPFFTTRQGRSGLGLATAYSIVKKHEGHLAVASEPGRGTIVTIYIPVACKAPAQGGGSAEGERDAFKGRILVMDDEEMIREVVQGYLKLLGYAGIAVGDGTDAVAAYRLARAEGRPFDAVILDVTVPGGMGGKEAIRRLREIDPAVRGIVTSGYSNDPVMSDFRGNGFCGAVSKPFRLQDLAVVLDRLLGEAASGLL